MLRRIQNFSNFPSSFFFCFEFSPVFSLSYPFSALGLALAIFTELFHEERKWQHDTHFLFLGRVEWSWICFPFFGDGAVERERERWGRSIFVRLYVLDMAPGLLLPPKVQCSLPLYYGTHLPTTLHNCILNLTSRLCPNTGNTDFCVCSRPFNSAT
jgi:hypothetical protein